MTMRLDRSIESSGARPGPPSGPRDGEPSPSDRSRRREPAEGFEAQGNISLVDIQTYLYYIQLKSSRPSEGVWVPYDESSERTIREDFLRLWGTNFLDNISIETQDYTFSNGVMGKLVVYNLEERQRVKIVDYTGSKKVETTKIDEALKEANAQIRLDTFIDPGLVKKVEGIVRDLMKEKGFQFASVSHEIKEMAGGPKLVHLTFTMDEGPKVKIRSIEFVGNQAIGDGALKRHMKENKQQWFLSFMTGRGTYQEGKFDEDAERVTEFYRDHGYVKAVLGQPELKFIEDSSDKKTRFVELRIPVTEGKRYRVGDFNFAGNTVVKTEALRPLFKINAGDYYNQKRIRQGFQKSQELYGAGGYFEFTGYPDMKFRDEPNPAEPADTGRAGGRADARRRARHRRHHDADSGGQAVLRESHHVHRQQHHARQRHPPRDAVVRERHLQHRGAQIQHPAVESAGLLQGARGARQRRDVREDARMSRARWTCGCSSKSRTAISSPSAPASRSSKGFSVSCRFRPRTFSAAARA